jgi:[ribosomal protein S18]-alanine N-acetyltransferase
MAYNAAWEWLFLKAKKPLHGCSFGVQQLWNRSNRLRIREVKRGDVDALFALDQKCFRPGIAYSKAELLYFLFHPHSISVVAESAAGIAGFAIVELLLENGRHVGHIVTIDVSPTQRRRGVGRLLMDALLDFCRKAEAGVLRLEVAVDNDAALAFYRRLGFAETGRIPGFYMGRLDALTMGLDVESTMRAEMRVSR